MNLMRPVAVVAFCVALLTGCGEAAEDGLKTISSSPKRSLAAACATEFQAVSTAYEAYFALNGEAPKTIDDLLDMLAERPAYLEIEPDGALGFTDEAEEAGCAMSDGS